MAHESDYNVWPGMRGTGSSSLGSCICLTGGGFNGPVYQIIVYKGPFAHKMNHPDGGVGRGGHRISAIFVSGEFTEFKYGRNSGTAINPSFDSRTVDVGHVARFFQGTSPARQTWLDEKWCEHVKCGKAPAFMLRSKRTYPDAVLEHGVHLYIGHHTSSMSISRIGVAGYPDVTKIGKFVKVDVGKPGFELDEHPPDAGGSFIHEDFSMPASLLGTHIVSADCGFVTNGIQIALLRAFDLWRGYDASGGEVNGADYAAPGNIHLTTWDEYNTWFVGGRRNAFGDAAADVRELQRWSIGGNGDNLWNNAGFIGGEADANTLLITSGVPPIENDDKHDFIAWGRAVNYAGITYKWNLIDPAPKKWAIMKCRRDGSHVGLWACDIEADGNGPVPFDVDGNGNIYFGGPVHRINGTSVQPNQLYRVDWRGQNEIQFGQFDELDEDDNYVRAGVVNDAKVAGTVPYGDTVAAHQIIVGGKFGRYTAPAGAFHADPVLVNHLCVLSTEQQQLESQLLWPAPWRDGPNQLKVGDFMPGLIW